MVADGRVDHRGRCCLIVGEVYLVVEVISVRGVRDDWIVEPLPLEERADLLHPIHRTQLLVLACVGVGRPFRVEVQ